MKRNNTEGYRMGHYRAMCRKWRVERFQIALRGIVMVNTKDSCHLPFKA